MQNRSTVRAGAQQIKFLSNNNTNMKMMRIKTVLPCLAAAFLPAPVFAQIDISTLDDGTYTETFDLSGSWTATSTRAITWTQNTSLDYTDIAGDSQLSDIEGWFLDLVSDTSTPTYATLTRSSTSGGNVLIGPGNAASTSPKLSAIFVHGSKALGEMALALRTTDSTQNAVGVVFYNGGSTTIHSIEISYVGEEWRKEANSIQSGLDFQYKIVSEFSDPENYHIWADTGWIDVDALDFTAPKADGTAGNITGNDLENCSLRYAVISATIEPGQYMIVRWLNASANTNSVASHVLGIDDLYVHFETEEITSFAPPQFFDGTAVDDKSFSAGNLGDVFASDFPWLYQNGLGWIYGAGNHGRYYFYLMGFSSLGWIYTSNDIYPYMYDFDRDCWFYQDQSVSNSSWFFDFSVGEWVEIGS
jgi:hypothetical protein